MITAYTGESIMKRAQEKKLISVAVVNPREYSTDRHNKVDDKAYGGGPGMVMTAEPILRAVQKLKLSKKAKSAQSADRPTSKAGLGGKVKVVMLSPGGKQFTNEVAKKWAKQYSDIIFICGRYEGVDDRVRKILKAEEVSVGPYILTGGELPALTIADAVTRQIPGVLGKGESLEDARTASPRTYTRPETLTWQKKKYTVPKVLLSGNHKDIEEWRLKQSKIVRPTNKAGLGKNQKK